MSDTRQPDRNAIRPGVCWLVQSLAEVPQDDSWLSTKERAIAGRMYFERRRLDWKLGRWTAKQAILRYLGLSSDADQASRLQVLAAADGAPEAFLEGMPSAIVLSISHSADVSFCTVAPAGIALGCDLEEIRPREENFAADYFTGEELHFVERAAPVDRPLLVTMIWSAKESVLKALRHGLRRDTRSIQVIPPDALGRAGWSSLTATDLESSRTFYGWIQVRGSQVQTVAADLATAVPTELDPIAPHPPS